MRLVAILVLVSACAADGVERDAGARRDASSRDAARASDGGDDGGSDASSTFDTGASCTPAHTECRGELECGAVPNGCPGETIDCGKCGDGILYCAVLEPSFQMRVYRCTQDAQDMHPEWFDPVMFRDTSSWLVLEAAAVAYVAFVASCSAGSDAVAIADPNAPGNEVRIRAKDGDLAENVIVRTYGTGRTAGRYTSSCTPAGF
jgi:hypothetical protein